jgi:hypothetical protein
VNSVPSFETAHVFLCELQKLAGFLTAKFLWHVLHCSAKESSCPTMRSVRYQELVVKSWFFFLSCRIADSAADQSLNIVLLNYTLLSELTAVTAVASVTSVDPAHDTWATSSPAILTFWLPQNVIHKCKLALWCSGGLFYIEIRCKRFWLWRCKLVAPKPPGSSLSSSYNRIPTYCININIRWLIHAFIRNIRHFFPLYV